MRGHRLLILVALAAALAAYPVASALAGSPAHAAPAAHAAAAGQLYKASVSYAQTGAGHTHGNTTTQITGKGTFSVKLTRHAGLAVALMSLVTGLPLNKMAEGGSYVQEWTAEANGNDVGTVVAHFKAHGLGTLCVSYVTKHGHYVPGASFVPATGSFQAVGGTAAAARWHGGVTYKQTEIGGASTEIFGVTGSEHGSVGAARGLSSACKHVPHS